MTGFTLYLRDDEKELFEKLPAKVRKGCTVVEETLDSFENPVDLKIRALMFQQIDKKTQKAIEDSANSLIKAHEKEKDPKKVFASMKALPPEIMLEIFFTIGAVGMTHLLKAFLSAEGGVIDLEVLAELSKLRHAMLESNAEVSTASM